LVYVDANCENRLLIAEYLPISQSIHLHFQHEPIER